MDRMIWAMMMSSNMEKRFTKAKMLFVCRMRREALNYDVAERVGAGDDDIATNSTPFNNL